MKTKLKLSVLFVIALTVLGPAQAQTTAFTYNGRLNDNGAPVTGAYDLQFTIFDSSGGATVVAGPLSVNGLGVTNGLFATRLDFGAGVFTGPDRWLEIQVRPAGNGNFEALSPRQELTSSPYAIRAQSAGTATDVSNGSVVKSLNTLKDNVTLAAGANVTLTPSGNTLTIASSGAGGGGSWSLNGANTYYNAGGVGVGTDSPVTRFTVAGAGAYNSPTAAAIALDNTVAPRRWEWHALDDGRLQLADFTLAATRLMIDTAGNVGIGSSAPSHRLKVSGGPAWTASGWGGAVELDNASAIAWRANAAGNRFGIGQSSGGLYFFASASDPGTTGSPADYLMTINDSGNVGIGTTTPAERLSILDFSGGNSSGLNITGLGADGVGMAIQSVGPGGHKWALVSGGVFNPFIPGIAGNFRIIDETANATRLVIAPDGNVGIGALANPGAKLDVQGNTRTTSITITGGADLAEPFPFSATIAQGSVVIIDDEQPGKLKLSARAYDTRVAGIVSGANGVRPGITLSQEGLMEGDQKVALSGRVYVKSDATSGAIKPGDLLTTSDTPGHAMKVADSTKAQGAILGKAMSGLNEGKGMVLVLVTLQ